MKRLLSAAFALAALTACEVPSAPPPATAAPATAPAPALSKAGATKMNLVQPFSGILYDTCTGDTITFTGKAHSVLTTVNTDTSNYFEVHTNTAAVSGIGTSGIRYRFIQNYRQEISMVFAPPFPNSIVDKQVVRMISEGSAPNQLVDVTNVFSFDGVNLTIEQKYRSRCTP
jgi:hypothetical protein